MKRHLFTLIFFMSFLSNIFAQGGYESLWKNVTDAQRKDLPKQVIECAEKIYDKASKEKCYPQLMKAWITIIETKSNLDPDSFRIENFPPIPHEKPVEAAIYNAVMGSAYLVMCDTYITENDEETKQEYKDKAEACFAAALSDKETLANTSAQDYDPLTSKEEDSKYYDHDMLSLITHFIIEHGERTNAQNAELCAAAADYYKQNERMEAWTLMTLQKIQYLSLHEDYNVRHLAQADKKEELKKMVDQTLNLTTGVDVAAAYLNCITDEDERLEFARWAQKQYEKTNRISLFKSTERAIMAPSLSVTTDSNPLADRPFSLNINAKNETKATLEVRLYNGKDKNRNLKTDGKLILARHYTFCQDAVMSERHSKNLPVQDQQRDTIALPVGHYVYVIKGKTLETSEEAYITSLRLLSFELPKDRMLFVVVNNETGRPVSNASIRLKDYQDQVQKTIQYLENGEAIVTKKQEYRYAEAFIEGTEDITQSIYIHNYNYGRIQPQTKEESEYYHTSIFTDRAIYRPGQTIHVSGLVYKQLKDRTEVVANIDKNITLRDANYRNIATQEVKSNEMGTYDLCFELPKDAMPGRFTITDGSETISIRVEEYKRPTFDVNAHLAMGNNQDENTSFSFGDTIQVEAEAKTFSGVPVQGAKVHYVIQTAAVDFWRWYNADWDTLNSGDIETDDEGKAAVSLFLDPKKLQDPDYGLVRYQVTFDVTDQAGETHSDSYYVSVSRRSFSLNINMKGEINLASKEAENKFTIEAINASRKPVTANGTYSINRTTADRETIVKDLPFTSGQELKLPSSLTPGSYRIKAQAMDRDEVIIYADFDFTVYNSLLAIDIPSLKPSKDNPANHTLFNQDFFRQGSTYFSEQQEAEVIFSPSKEDVYLSYMILSNDQVVDRGSITIGRQQYRLSIPYDKKFGDGISVILWYVRDGEICNKSLQFSYQVPNKKLDLSWSTFRDKLYPGQEEEWILSIRNQDGKPVVGAEMLATMYDASLDQLAANHWNFSIHFNRQVNSWSTHYSSANLGHSLYYQGSTYILNDKERKFDELREFIHDRYIYRRKSHMMFATASRANIPMDMHFNMMAVEENATMPNVVERLVEVEDNAVFEEAEEIVMPKSKEAVIEEPEIPEVTLRSNFAETAFFYPHLRSDENGNVKISFTLPESLTEWKFIGLAHTSDVDYGSIIGKTVARKDFMIQPNMPRFVREGDKAVITARVINQCDHALSGKAQIRLLDAETEQLVHTETIEFSVEAEKTSAVSFSIDIDDKYPMLICEIVGITENFSDGERNYLPVLSSKKYITEAIPFYITREETEKRIDLTEIFNENSSSATHRRMLLEFTEHPEWTVIEALDGIKLPEQDNAPCFAAALYSNTMAKRLAQRIPGFEQALLYAKQHGIEATSQLDENQDLKDIVSIESPWVRDALAEAEQRQRLLDLFDNELMDKRIETAKAKLLKLQLSDGSWTWFEGMPGNYYITLSTCRSLAMMQSEDSDIQKMLVDGLQFLDKQELENYKDRVKHKYSLYPSSSTIDYLYIWAMMPEREVSKELRKMRETYLKQLEGNVRDLTIKGRSFAAVILRAFGHTKSADDFLESAVQYTITKPGMGRYYATDAAYYSWCDYRIPTQLATMNALRMSQRDDRITLLREMQIWLLRQKQTQTWDNPMNTISAVDFLLNDSDGLSQPNESDTSGVNHTFAINSNALPVAVDTTKFLASELGYIRTEVEKSYYEQAPKELVVTSQRTEESEGSLISWGALYTQYLEEMDQLKNQSSGELKVSIKLIVPNAPKDEENPVLHVGDKVTLRVIVSADRDMDFVQIRMQRPACFEPDNQLSGYCWMNGRGGYVAQHDASTDIFFDTFRKGTMTYDIDYHVDRQGVYLTGVTTAQCAYSPEFTAHTRALHITVE